jgi:hypothetical protein
MATNYNVSPAPTTGQGAFGEVPGQTALPPSIWDQLNSNIPGYGAMTTSATGDIQSQLNGTLSPSTMSNIGNYAASRGVSLGQPNSPMSNEIGMNVTGTTTEGLEQQGLGNYNTFTGTAGSEQQNPALMADISQSNAVLGSAPDPSAAAAYSQSLYDEYMAKMNPAGGTGGFSMTGNPQGNYSQFPMFGGGGAGAYGSINYGGGGSPYSVYNTGGYGQDNVGF